MKIVSMVMVVIVGWLFIACSPENTSRIDGLSPEQNGLENQEVLSSTLEKEYLDAINKARRENQTCGSRGFFSATNALKWNSKLYHAAYEHSNDMAVTNTFSHEGSGQASDLTGVREGGKSHGFERMEAYGYEWSRYGENIAAGTNSNTAQKVMTQWMESDGHCANIMNPDFTEVGMAMVKKSDTHFTHYWTQNFGRP